MGEGHTWGGGGRERRCALTDRQEARGGIKSIMGEEREVRN